MACSVAPPSGRAACSIVLVLLVASLAHSRKPPSTSAADDNGSKNSTNSTSVTLGPMLISEFLASPGASGIRAPGSVSPTEWIELVNNSTDPVDLKGWVLSDSKNWTKGWTMPSQVVPPGGYQLIYLTSLQISGPGPNGTLIAGNLKLKKSGEAVYLYDPQKNLASSTSKVPKQEKGVTYGLPGTAAVPPGATAANSSQLPGLSTEAAQATAPYAPLQAPTPGAANTPAVKPAS